MAEEVEKLQAQLDELKESLATQIEANKALGADLKKAKADLRKGQEIDPADYTNLQNDFDALNAKYTALDKDFKKVTGERDTLAKTLETESKITMESQRDLDLTNALTSMNVTDPIKLKYVKNTLKDQVQVVTEGDKRISKVGDKTLTDFVKEWAVSEEGKHFISAPNNSGGGSNGGGSGSETIKGKLDGTQAERAAYFKQKFKIEQGV